MNKSINNWIKSFYAFASFAFVFLLTSESAFAALTSGAPSFSELRPILVRIINILIMCAGGVLVIMIAYGIWKSSLAAGDPRALEGAKSTWTYALYGFFIVVGAMAAYMIIQGLVGISSGSGGLAGRVVDAINDLMNIQSTP